MKTLAIVCLLLLGCNDSVRVISSDGTQDLAWCSYRWVECVAKVCPDGYDVVTDPSFSSTGLLRCKP